MKVKKNSPPLDDRIQAEMLQLIYRQSYPDIFVSLLSCALLSAILWSVQQKEVLISWAFILTCTALIRLTLFTLFNRMKPQGVDILSWGMP